MILQKTLYNLNSKNQIIEWNLLISNLNLNEAEVVIRHGLHNCSSSNSPSSKYVIPTLNKEKHFLSLLNKKTKREGYVEDWNLLKDVKTTYDNLYSPMLAKTFDLEKPLSETVFAQPKYNGVRMLAYVDLTENFIVFKSRKNIVYNFPLIAENLKQLLINAGIDKITLDGELYSHKLPLSVISGEARRSTKTPSHYPLNYIIYDIVNLNSYQYERLDFLSDLFLGQDISNIKLSPTNTLRNKESIKVLLNQMIEEGYEGLIIREKKGMYKPGARVLGKVKKLLSKEFTIIDIIPQNKQKDLGIFVCKNDLTDDYFSVTYASTMEEKRDILINKNKYIGKLLTVDYFERTVNNLPFHAVGVAIRDYE
jgi:DNA ligase-1